MARSIRALATLFPFLALLLVAAAPARAGSASGGEVAHRVLKVPEQAEATPNAEATSAETGTGQASAASPTQAQFAMLIGAVSSRLSAVDLIDLAAEYGWYKDEARERDCLEEAAALGAGSREAGQALVWLGLSHDLGGDQAQADALYDQALVECSDAEVQAFADLVRAYGDGVAARDVAALESLLADAADRWRGTAVGGWAALRLGDVCRFMGGDNQAAILAFEAAVRDYRTGPIVEEARVAIAECADWSEGDKWEAIALYQAVLDEAQYTRTRLRAVVGLGDCLRDTGDLNEAVAVLSEVIDLYPDRPAADLARVLRAAAAARLGDRELAAADAQAYVASPQGQPVWRAFAHHLLGRYAFQEGRLEEAEAQFASARDWADGLTHRSWLPGKARAAIASCRQAQGDLDGALALLLEAADRAAVSRQKALYLYQAALLSEEAGDRATTGAIIDRMIEECPGSYLTSRLLGHEVLLPPEI